MALRARRGAHVMGHVAEFVGALSVAILGAAPAHVGAQVGWSPNAGRGITLRVSWYVGDRRTGRSWGHVREWSANEIADMNHPLAAAAYEARLVLSHIERSLEAARSGEEGASS